MAALIEPLPLELRDLRSYAASYLEPLLTEESGEWREQLDWDFTRSAELVRRFVDLRALSGSVLLEKSRIAGYCYYVFEDNKGLIGDIYVARRVRSRYRELLLLETAVREMMAAPFVTRIESQLMLSPMYPIEEIPFSDDARLFERDFMMADIGIVRGLPARDLGHRVRIDSWADYYQEAAALLIEESYRDHIDSLINDQYRTLGGARRFLYNIVNYPGCGAFSPAASLVAVDSGGTLAGLSLASVVNGRTGHITQICVAPGFRGTGLGYELLRRSLLRLMHLGCQRASLTVTSTNTEAIRLYERTGFKTLRHFHAYVWEGWRG